MYPLFHTYDDTCGTKISCTISKVIKTTKFKSLKISQNSEYLAIEVLLRGISLENVFKDNPEQELKLTVNYSGFTKLFYIYLLESLTGPRYTLVFVGYVFVLR